MLDIPTPALLLDRLKFERNVARLKARLERLGVPLRPHMKTAKSVDILNLHTYDESAGLLNPFRPEDRDVIHRRVRAQLIIAARESGILAHAEESASRLLTELLARDGYRVEIRRPPVQVAPTG